jgi:hypothetical protein
LSAKVSVVIDCFTKKLKKNFQKLARKIACFHAALKGRKYLQAPLKYTGNERSKKKGGISVY